MSCPRLETLAQVFSWEFCEISKKTFFYRAPPVSGFDYYQVKNLSKLLTYKNERPRWKTPMIFPGFLGIPWLTKKSHNNPRNLRTTRILSSLKKNTKPCLGQSIQKWTKKNLWQTAFKTPSNVLKAVFHKFYRVHSWILLSHLYLVIPYIFASS